MAPRAPGDSVRPRRLAGLGARPLNFTVRQPVQRYTAISSTLALLICLGPGSPRASAPALWPGAFRLLEATVASDGSRRYLADASEGSSHCQFNIHLRLNGRSLFGSEVTLSRLPDTDCRRFLEVLAQVLHYKGAIPSSKPRADLTAPMAFFGDHEVRLDGGSFTSGATGTWLVSKLFLAEGSSEVFFNLDATNHIGEFSLKDDEYAATVISELASILLPR